MKIIFESEDRKFEAEVYDYEDIFYAVRDGMVAMSYHKDTAKELVEELKKEEKEK